MPVRSSKAAAGGVPENRPSRGYCQSQTLSDYGASRSGVSRKGSTCAPTGDSSVFVSGRRDTCAWLEVVRVFKFINGINLSSSVSGKGKASGR